MAAELSEHALVVSDKVESEVAIAQPASPEVTERSLDSVLNNQPASTAALDERALGDGVGRFFDPAVVDRVAQIAAGTSHQSQRIAELLGLAEGLRPDDVDGFRTLAHSVGLVWRGQEEFLLAFFEALDGWLQVDDRLAVLGTTAARTGEIVMAFLEGMLDTVENANLLDPAIRDRVVEQHLNAILYLNVFYSPITILGAVCGFVKRGVDDFVGMAELAKALSWDLDQTVDFVAEALGKITLDSAPALARDLGAALAEGVIDPVMDLLLEDRVIHFAFGVGKLFGPLAIDVVLSFTGIGLLAKTAFVTKVVALLEKVFGTLDPDFVRIVNRLGGKADNDLKRRFEKALDKLDKNSPEYQGYQALLEDGDESMLEALISGATCGAG
jgi:hypothetical protein